MVLLLLLYPGSQTLVKSPQVLTDGDPVQFEAVPQEAGDNTYYCSWFASLVWKGKRPPFEDPNMAGSNTLAVSGRLFVLRKKLGLVH